MNTKKQTINKLKKKKKETWYLQPKIENPIQTTNQKNCNRKVKKLKG